MKIHKKAEAGGAPRCVRGTGYCYTCRRPAWLYDSWVYLFGGKPYCASRRTDG